MEVSPVNTQKNRSKLLKITTSAVIAAVYAALTILLAPISYGAVQFRVSEALTVLPFLMPGTVWGLFAGCVIANLYTGSVLDIVFGSLATFLAGLLTAWFGRRGNTVKNRLLGCLMPVLFNAVIVGAVLTWGYGIRTFASPLASYGFNALTVGLGETGVLYLIGYTLLCQLPKIRVFREFFERFNRS
ncbi:MAG: QueT transporter family protein [Oscillospiraceae bacterium]|nr:QueT transporter family protein [Oscillospiraceae bacterium]